MSILDLFSKRQKRLRGEVSDVYVYDTIPQALRVQIVHIWDDSLGHYDDYMNKSKGGVKAAYGLIAKTLRREYGVFVLPTTGDRPIDNFYPECKNFLLDEQDPEKVLDIIELSFQIIDKHTRGYNYRMRSLASKIADEAIDELNGRFKEHGIGFQFMEGEIIRVDSQHIHADVVKPALSLLQAKEYSGAQDEYLKAYEHYRHKNFKEALNECLKAFESVMKSICDKRKWNYPANATSKKLIAICLDNGLIPDFWQHQFSSLRSILESSVPTARNKLGGHGQGSSSIDVPEYLVAYVLHMTASAIVFLVEAEKGLK